MLLLTLLLTLALMIWINTPLGAQLIGRRGFDSIRTLPEMAGIQAGSKLLLLAPHLGDETLCCAGLIQQAIARGAQVNVLWLTADDGAGLLGGRAASTVSVRMQEARRAARQLGLEDTHLGFLGYPEGSLMPLFLDYYTEPYPAGPFGVTLVTPPSTLAPGQVFTGANLERSVQQVIDRLGPDLVFLPAAESGSSDHRVVSYIGTRLFARRGQLGRLRFWMVHGGLEWPLPKGLHPQLALTPPPLGRRLSWELLNLTSVQQDVKRQAIRSYRTQLSTSGRFMLAFDRRNELFASMSVRGSEYGLPANLLP